MATTDDAAARVREVRLRLAQEGPPWARDHAGDFTAVAVPGRHADHLRDLLVAEQAETVVEIGLAYAGSALAIGEALLAAGRPHPRHVVIDPFQDSEFSDVGWNLLRSAGLDATTTLLRTPSSLALPQLLTEGFTADAAFVDGSHRFHEVFVDLYFLRKIVRPGGLIVIDDDWWPSVHTAAQYYERNLAWTPIPDAFPGRPVGPAPPGTPTTRPRCKAYRLPPPSEPPFQDFRPFATT